MQEVWTINSSCRTFRCLRCYCALTNVELSGPGDCGSLVVDAQYGTIYGMIVATSSDAQETYLIPAKDILNSLKAEWSASNIEFFTRTFWDEQRIVASRATVPSPPNNNMVAAAAGKREEDIRLPNPPLNTGAFEYSVVKDMEKVKASDSPGARSINHTSEEHDTQAPRLEHSRKLDRSEMGTYYYCCNCGYGPLAVVVSHCSMCYHLACGNCTYRPF